MDSSPRIAAARIVVIMPNWLGDAVMATPFLRALRTLYPTAHLATIARPIAVPVLEGLPFVDEIHVADRKNEAPRRAGLRSRRFDLGILLRNSFRSAWTLFRGGVPRRVGYRRGWRGPLLTDSILPVMRTAEQRG